MWFSPACKPLHDVMLPSALMTCLEGGVARVTIVDGVLVPVPVSKVDGVSVPVPLTLNSEVEKSLGNHNLHCDTQEILDNPGDVLY